MGRGPAYPRASLLDLDQSQNLGPAIIKAVNRMELNGQANVKPHTEVLNLRRMGMGKANDCQVINFVGPQNLGAGPGYLSKFLAKFGYPAPLAANGLKPGARRRDRPRPLPPVREAQALIQEACHNFLNYAQERPAPLGQMQLSPGFAAGPYQQGYCFPVAPPYTFRDTWGDRRGGGRYHHAVDIFAGEGTPVYAITAGIIHKLVVWPGAGITLFLRGHDGKGYGYMHLQGYAPGLVEGKGVQAGELIAYVGRTGIKRESAHLHLQVHADHNFEKNQKVNPYGLLVQLCNGKGVTDLGDGKIARWRIPQAEFGTHGTVRLSSSGPRRFQSGVRSFEDAGKIYIHN